MLIERVFWPFSDQMRDENSAWGALVIALVYCPHRCADREPEAFCYVCDKYYPQFQCIRALNTDGVMVEPVDLAA